MKKIKKKKVTPIFNFQARKPDVKCSRVTIDSRVCNEEKFNEFFELVNNVIDYKKTISDYCFTNLTSIVTDYDLFLTTYKNFPNSQLNSWETQNIFQEIASHYSETAKRHLNTARFVVSTDKLKAKKSNLVKLTEFINSQSNLIQLADKSLVLNFDIPSILKQLNEYLTQYNTDLISLTHKELISKLEKKIAIYHKLIAKYHDIQLYSLSNPIMYNRIIELLTKKKLRLLSKVKLGIYTTGTHTRSIANSQMSIVEDLTNGKYQHFLRFRKFNKLIGREPKDKNSYNISNNPYKQDLLDYNEKNFIYLPLTFNSKKLRSISKSINKILTKDNPQVLIKSEQLRIGKLSRKIHIIFNYEAENNLGKVIDDSFINNINIEPTIDNTLGLDVNCKNNLLADSRGIFYNEIIKFQEINKSNFINNLNEIVLLQSKPLIDRTEKKIYSYNKLLRTNESLLKNYLSGLIKDWKNQNILHLVLEDLNIINDKTYYEHKGIKIKFSRLSRLLRFGQIKHWVASMAEKQGLFTHIVNPAYTSQECSKCHYISPNNRTKQEDFICKNPGCNHKENADTNAAKCIEYRLLNKNIRNILGIDNVYLSSRAKPINYKLVKSIIADEYKLGVITELFPNKLKDLKTKKDSMIFSHTEAPSFRSG